MGSSGCRNEQLRCAQKRLGRSLQHNHCSDVKVLQILALLQGTTSDMARNCDRMDTIQMTANIDLAITKPAFKANNAGEPQVADTH